MALVDPYGRKVDYLRLAITDRCNLRCRYCMPAEGVSLIPREELLNYDEIIRLSGILGDLGIEKVRLTGGEPFVRKDFPVLMQGLMKQFRALYITSNAAQIHHHWSLLEQEEIRGINISIDSLDQENFKRICRRDLLEQTLNNIEGCLERNIPIKLNTVVMKGINAHEIMDFVAFGRERGISIRFIEAMPFNASDGNREQFMSYKEIIEEIRKSGTFLLPAQETNKPSSSLQFLSNGSQMIEVIPAYSRLLCGSCNRLRLTTEGNMRTCLYASKGLDLRALLRSGASDLQIAEEIVGHIGKRKKSGHEEEEDREETVFESMTRIGG